MPHSHCYSPLASISAKSSRWPLWVPSMQCLSSSPHGVTLRSLHLEDLLSTRSRSAFRKEASRTFPRGNQEEACTEKQYSPSSISLCMELEMETRPTCPCHGEPMSKNGSYEGRKKWICAQKRRLYSRRDYYERGQRERKRELYRQRKEAGLCTKCAQPSLTTALCWSCLSKAEENYGLRI